MDYTFTEEDIKFVEKAVELKAKGYYIDSMQLTEHYNRILHKSVNNTSCGSCMRQRVTELEQALNHYKAKQQEASKLSDVVEIVETPKKETKKSKK